MARGDQPGEIYAPEEVRAILAQCSRRAPTGIRDRALLTLIYRAGLRIGEALELKVSDIDMRRGTIHIRRTKTRKDRWLAVGDGVLAVLQVWLDKRKELGLARNGIPLFCTLQGSPVSYSATDAMLKRRAAKAGVEKRVHLHGLRHSYAAGQRERGTDVETIRRQLGHTNLNTTQVYLDHIAPADVLAIGRADDWTDE